MAEVPGAIQLQGMILRILSLLGGLAFIVLVVVLVIGGIKYLTSGGEQKAVASAQQTITWAILGIVFFVLAWLILLLISTFTGADEILDFCLWFTGCS